MSAKFGKWDFINTDLLSAQFMHNDMFGSQSGINPRSTCCTVWDRGDIWTVSCVSFGQLQWMATRRFVLYGRSDLGNGARLFCKGSILHSLRICMWVTSLIQYNLWIDSGDTAVAAVKRSYERCAKIFAMASWLGITAGRWEGIQRIETS